MDSERPHPESVSVELSDCTKGDARIVFDTLCACFASDRCGDDVPQEASRTRPTVWLGTFDVAAVHEGARPVRLTASVTADIQGGYWAVDRFRTILDSLFSVQEVSTASGDQEKDVHVRLESRPSG